MSPLRNVSQSPMGADVGTNLIDGHVQPSPCRAARNGGADVGTNLIDGHYKIGGAARAVALGADVGTNLIDGHKKAWAVHGQFRWVPTSAPT